MKELAMSSRRSFCVLAVLCSLAVPAQAAETLRIYRLDGSRQCEEGTGRSLARDAQALRRLGIRIHSMAKRNHPTMLVIMMCGAQSARANTYVIAGRDWRRHGKRLKGFDNWPK
jgi:hypothetical protein